ncbi:MAG: sigma-70 family RNA polymerase sigma factor [Flavobacteriaceae bacterium]
MVRLDELIKKCKKNDRNAQSILFSEYKETLYLISLKYCRNEVDAQDNLHDAFMVIFEKIKTYKGKGSFEGWMKRITIYKAIDRYKRKKEIPLEPIDYSDDDTSIDSTFLDISLDILLDFIQKLPDQYRLVFNLYQLDGYSHKEIAEILSISENTSKTNYHRAKLQLKQKIIDFRKEGHSKSHTHEK